LEGGLRHPRLSAVWGVEVLFGNRFSGRAQERPEDSHTRARPRRERHPLIPAIRQEVSDQEATRRGGLLPGATEGQPVERRGEEEEFVHTQTPTARLKRGHSGATPREAEAPSGQGHFFLALAASFPEHAQALAQKGRECCCGVRHTFTCYSRAGELSRGCVETFDTEPSPPYTQDCSRVRLTCMANACRSGRRATSATARVEDIFRREQERNPFPASSSFARIRPGIGTAASDLGLCDSRQLREPAVPDDLPFEVSGARRPGQGRWSTR
jgi:hypothetical protein